MPGILPMKVIKVGGASQSRVAQACDRCRSKKIRCDGVRPTCSQCANVGFECKTSDKLSRRAFPRGYTESLEDRVRSLEAEVHELKCLLDEKDEKIDVLSRLHSMAPSSRVAAAPSPASTNSESGSGSSPTKEDPDRQSPTERDDLIHVQHSSSLLRKPTQGSPFTGPSSTKAFIDAFAHKLESSGKSLSAVSTDTLLSPPTFGAWQQNSTPKTPPRLVSDQLLNIFFQEWAPLYPVVYRPAILKLYGRYTTNPDSIEDDKYSFAQLNLVFGIAAISSTSRVPQDPAFFERNWTPKLEDLSHDISLSALQCYVLAQIYYSIKSDYKSVLRYRGIAVAICLQLGLHQSQKRFSFNPLINETRKRVFWCQYTLDRFAAALTGLPVLISESDICTEYPTNVDDENVTETGFVPTPQGEATRISSALALFGASRILNRVLSELYPSPAGYKVSLSAIHSLAEELDEWQKALPSHLRLEFAQDKPSTNVTGSRSPLLSAVYYFIRTLIRRPAVCFGQPGTSSTSMLSLVDSAKHIVQILKLLEERRMSLSLSINKRELIFVSGLGLLWQNLDLNRDSKLVKEGQKLLYSALGLLECEAAEAAAEFGALINIVCPIEGLRRNSGEQGKVSRGSASAQTKQRSPKKLEARLSNPSGADKSSGRKSSRGTPIAASAPNLSSVIQSPTPQDTNSDQHFQDAAGTSGDQHSSDFLKLDFLQFENCKSDWEHVLSGIESGHSNIYTGIYGGSECGEAPAAFATLNGPPPLYPQPPQGGQQRELQQQQQHHPHQHHQHQQQQQQHQQMPATSSLADLQAGLGVGGTGNNHTHDMHDWTPESWTATVANGLHPDPSTQSVISYSEDGLESVGDISPSSVMSHNPHHHPHHPHNQVSQSGLDPIEALMIPHTLDSLDGTDYGASDGPWAPQCVM